MTDCNPETFADAFNLLCGDVLGAGVHRTVYACALMPQWVVKVENTHNRFFANVHEAKFWSDHQWNDRVLQWLAPCGDMSPDGRILLQRRVDPLPFNYELPEKMPAFLADLKRSNFGIFEDRLVCVDYAIINPTASTRMAKARWA